MRILYTCIFKILICVFCLIGYKGIAQTTLTTPIPTGIVYYSDTDPGVIVFGVKNNNANDVVVTNLSSYVEVGGGGTYSLWYHTSAVTGAPTQVTTANGWVQATPSGTVTVTGSGVIPILSGLNITIPSGATYRFALQSPIHAPYYGTAGSTGTLATTGNVDLYMQGNPNSPTYTGSFNALPATTPRSFYGSITFVPANACTGTPNAGNAVLVNASSSLICGSNNFTLDLSGNSIGTGQTYQWQSSTNGLAPWTNVGTASTSQVFTTTQTATKYYRCEVICGSGTPSYSSSVKVDYGAQLSGTYTINNTLPSGGINFNSFTDAFNALACGASGPVVFNVSAGQTFSETPPQINFTGTATNTITFKKDGVGANPVIMPSQPGTIASSTTVGGNGDGIIVINGGDYITFDGIDLNSNSFSSGVDMYEYGYYLKKASATNACKNVSIKNASITLNKAAIFSFGIFVSNFVGTTAATVTSTGGRSENIKLNGNNISSCYGGIQLRGYAAATPYDFYDQNIEIGVDSANNITDFGGGASIAYGVYAIYQNNLKIAKNSIVSATGTTTTMYGVFTSTAVNANVDIYGNTITLTGGGTTAAINGISNAMGGTGTNNVVNIYNNIITGFTYPTSTSGDIQGIVQTATAYKANIYGNTISDNTLSPTGAGIFYGIFQSGGVINESKIYNNNIFNNTRSTGTTGAWYGINNSPATTATSEIYGNIVYDNTIAVGTGGIMYGIAQTAGGTTNIYKNKVYGLTNNSTTTGVYGISVTSGTTNNVYNNFISDLKVSQASATTVAASDLIRAINVNYTTANTSINVQHNSIYLNASSSGTNFGSTGIFHTVSATATSASLTLKNNIVVNASIANGLGRTTAFRRSGTALGNYNVASNNNDFFVGIPNGSNGIFYDGTNLDDNISAYKARVSPIDNNTISEDAPFENIASAPYDLHIKNSLATQIESGGSAIASITQDIDGDARNATTPDIGADEFVGIPADFSGPGISYTALSIKTICIEQKTITATITDPSKVNVNAGKKPRLWFKKENELDVLPATNTAANNGWKWVEASNNVSPFTFTFNYSLLSSPLANGDSLSYFIVAQDSAITPNVGVNAATFSTAPISVALSNASFPVSGTINGFRILNIPNPLTIKVNKTELCSSGTVILDVDGVDVTGAAYQWQSTHHNTNNWTNIPSATTVPFTTAAITDSSDFRLVVTCGGTPISSSPSNIVSVNVNNPQLTSTTPATRCGTGTVDLAATAPGLDVQWYDVPTGGVVLFTGSPFTTPSISATKTFYAAASTGGTTQIANHGLPTVVTATQNSGLLFNLNVDAVLNSVDVYTTTGSGDVVITLANSTGTLLYTSPTFTVTTGTLTTPHTLTLDWAIPAGTGYRILVASHTPSLGYHTGTFPIDLGNGVGSVTTGATATGTTTLNYFIYNMKTTVGCTGTRTPVVATVSTAPNITSTGHKTICNNAVDSLSITSNIADFNTYIWSPVTDLYLDAAGTIAYNGTSANKVYVKSTTVGKTGYKCSATNTTTLCANEIVDTITIMPMPTLAVSPNQICVSGNSTLALNPSTGYGAGMLQWQSSTNNISYTDISGANAASYVTPTITTTTYYKLLLKNSAGTSCNIPLQDSVVVTSPLLTSTTPGYTCGTGSVNLSATTSAGYFINWYDVPTAGVALAQGNSFATPSISSTTTYYAAASTGGSTTNTGMLTTPGTGTSGAGTTNFGIVFDALSAFTLKSVVIYPVSATAGTPGSVTIDVVDGSGTVLHTATVSVVGNPATAPVPQTVELNFNIAPGTNYKLRHGARTGVSGLLFEPSASAPSGNYGYPYIVPGLLEIKHSTLTAPPANTQRLDLYYYFYNWEVSTGCESARVPVIATVNNDPGCIPTPVDLISFTGERRGVVNVLNWKTATELNNVGFEILRSIDGANFNKISYVNSKSINGNSNSILKYDYIDEKPFATSTYYRLKQIDKDGKYTLSNIVLIKAEKNSKLELVNVYPNPAKNNLNLNLYSPKAGKLTFVITDITGKTIFSNTRNVIAGDNNLQINVSSISKGTYLIKAICMDGCQTAVKKFIKE